MTTKILALTDALGNLVRFHLMPGNRFDSVGVPPLIDGVAFDGLIADKAFDSDAIIADLDERGAAVVVSQHPRRIQSRGIDPHLYTWRHLIENLFCKLKECTYGPFAVDLEKCTLLTPTGRSIPFQLSAYRRRGLLSGLDDIALTLSNPAQIRDYVTAGRADWPWLYPARTKAAAAGPPHGLLGQAVASIARTLGGP